MTLSSTLRSTWTTSRGTLSLLSGYGGSDQTFSYLQRSHCLTCFRVWRRQKPTIRRSPTGRNMLQRNMTSWWPRRPPTTFVMMSKCDSTLRLVQQVRAKTEQNNHHQINWSHLEKFVFFMEYFSIYLYLCVWYKFVKLSAAVVWLKCKPLHLANSHWLIYVFGCGSCIEGSHFTRSYWALCVPWGTSIYLN